jgi:hypothetical protein
MLFQSPFLLELPAANLALESALGLVTSHVMLQLVVGAKGHATYDASVSEIKGTSLQYSISCMESKHQNTPGLELHSKMSKWN